VRPVADGTTPAITVRTLAPAETVRLGERLGHALRAGDVVLLRGDLGAGKTHFARGIAAGLGIAGPVPSPTFTLANEYHGTNAAGEAVPLAHLDLYRLMDGGGGESGGDLDSVGLPDYFGGEWAAVVEWPEGAMLAGFVPPSYLDVALADAGETERQLTFTAHGVAVRLLDALTGEVGEV